MIPIGNFFFHHRNALFPVVYLLLLVPSPPLLADFRAAALLGLVVAVLGQLLRGATVGLDYIVRGGRHRRVYAEGLVQGGLFAHCRNPLYLGNGLILIGVGLTSNSLVFLGSALPFFAFAYAAIIAAEEAYLRGRFGAEFEAYCARVNRLWPRWTGLPRTFTESTFNWRRLITAEYGSAYVWIAAWAVVTGWNVLRSSPDAARSGWFWGPAATLVLATAGYCTARLLKKGGWLQAPARVKEPAPDRVPDSVQTVG